MTKSKKITNKTQYLVLLDHDGTLCSTAPSAYDSIKFATQMACEANQVDYQKLNIDWDLLFPITRGTTEKNFIKTFCFRYNIPFYRFDHFEERFYAARAIWFKNMKSFNENPYDTYFPDAENLVNICNHKNDITIWLITGNPRSVMKERMAKHLINYFSDKNGELLGSFGDEALTREELMQKAIDNATKNIKNFHIEKDNLGFATNVVYIGDGRRDFFSGLNAHVKTVWVPSRSLQEVKDILATDYMIFLKHLLKNRINVVNRIDSESVLNMLSINF